MISRRQILEVIGSQLRRKENMNTEQTDRIIYRRELKSTFGVSGETIRRWMRSHRLPDPDVFISQKTLGWKVSTLRAAGIDLA